MTIVTVTPITNATQVTVDIRAIQVTVSPNVISGGGTSVTFATRSSILSSHPLAGSLAFSTDTHEFYVYTGTAWYKASTPFIIDTLLLGSASLDFSIASNSQYIPMVN